MHATRTDRLLFRPLGRAFFAAMLLLVSCTPALAAPVLTLTEQVEAVPMGGYLDYLADPSGQLSIAEVADAAMADRFVPVEREVPNFGVTGSAFWFRFTIDNRDPARRWLIELAQPYIDCADLYLPDPAGGFTRQTSGDKRPMSSRPFRDRNILFALPSAPGRLTGYLRGQISGRAQFPFILSSAETLQEAQSVRNYAYGGLIGFALTVTIISLALYVFIREKSFLYFVLYILAFTLVHLTLAGYLFSGVFPEHPGLHDYCVTIVCFLPMLAVSVFTREFLNTSRHAPVFDKPLRWSIGVNLILPWLIFVIPTIPYKKLMVLDALILPLLLLAVSIEAVRNGYRPARYLLAARVLHQCAVMALMLAGLGLIPFSPYLGYAMMACIFFDGILIAFAQGERFNLLNRRIGALVADQQRQIDERTAANQALQDEIVERRRLEREVAQISDDERIRVGHDLHDGLCQQLSATLLHCNLLEEDLAGTRIDTSGVKAMADLLEEAVRDAYDIAKGLCPLDVDPESLIPALARLADNIDVATEIACEFRHDEIVSIEDREQTLHLYRIAQEAVANAVKHSGASRILMELQAENGKVRLAVEDDGRGMGNATTPTLGGMGLRIMSYRAGIIGGNLQIERPSGGGVRIVCLANAAATEAS